MTEKRRSLIKRALKYLVFIILIAAAAAGLKLFFDSRTVTTYTAPLSSVAVIRAEERDLAASASFSGYIESQAMIPVIPFVQGTITSFDIEAGDAVQKDQVIAQIDKEPYLLQEAQAQAAASAYQSSYDRLVQLQQVQAATQQDADTLRGQLDAANAQLELAQLQLSYTDVKAPVSGTVIMTNQTAGDIANSQTPLAVIADTDNLVMNIRVPERYYQIFREHEDELEIRVYSSDAGAETTAQFVSIAPYIDPASKSFVMKVRLDDPALFTIGMYVRAKVVYQHYSSVMALPERVMKSDGSIYYVEDSTARYIAPADRIHADGWFIAPEGFEDRLFVIEGQNSILDGERVVIREN